MEYKDYYKVMGVERDATQDQIKRAYRKLARKYHPDVSKEADAEERFKEVGEAYAVLKDPEKRTAYDQLGANWKSGQDFRPPPNWDEGFEVHGGGSAGGGEEFSDFFETLFGRGGFGQASRRPFRGRGEDTYAKIVVDLQDSYLGATRSVSLKHSEIGEDGRPVSRSRTLNVKIPKGVRPGQHIRLARQGSAGSGGGESGDLFLEIAFRPHPMFHVEGKNVYLNLPIAPWEAELGASVKTPTPTGSVNLTIPPHSKTGQKLRLKGRGLPGTEPGDFYAVLQIALPRAETEKHKAAYRDYASAFDFDPRRDMEGRS
jgi:curved DNA-binding protein